MALPADFNKIFGSTATGGLTPIGDVNYAKGWEFVGSNPPTKNDFSYLQNLSDLKSQWLYSNKLQRTNPFGDIKADGAAAIATALSNLGLGEAAKMPAAELVVNGNTLSAKIPVLAGGVQMNLIIQASQVSSSATSGTIIFPSAFPNACVMILSHDFSNSASDLSNVRFNIPGKSSVSWLAQQMNTGGEISPATWGWLAIGW